MEWLRRALGYQVDHSNEHAKVDQRLDAQQLRLNALDVAIQAQNAARPRIERRRVPR